MKIAKFLFKWGFLGAVLGIMQYYLALDFIIQELIKSVTGQIPQRY